jgi:hypothetical protein
MECRPAAPLATSRRALPADATAQLLAACADVLPIPVQPIRMQLRPKAPSAPATKCRDRIYCGYQLICPHCVLQTLPALPLGPLLATSAACELLCPFYGRSWHAVHTGQLQCQPKPCMLRPCAPEEGGRGVTSCLARFITLY